MEGAILSTSGVMGATKQRASVAFRTAMVHLTPEFQLRHEKQNGTHAPANTQTQTPKYIDLNISVFVFYYQLFSLNLL